MILHTPFSHYLCIGKDFGNLLRFTSISELSTPFILAHASIRYSRSTSLIRKSNFLSAVDKQQVCILHFVFAIKYLFLRLPSLLELCQLPLAFACPTVPLECIKLLLTLLRQLQRVVSSHFALTCSTEFSSGGPIGREDFAFWIGNKVNCSFEMKFGYVDLNACHVLSFMMRQFSSKAKRCICSYIVVSALTGTIDIGTLHLSAPPSCSVVKVHAKRNRQKLSGKWWHMLIGKFHIRIERFPIYSPLQKVQIILITFILYPTISDVPGQWGAPLHLAQAGSSAYYDQSILLIESFRYRRGKCKCNNPVPWADR